MYNRPGAGVAGVGVIGGVGAGSAAAGGELPVTGFAVGALLVLAFALILLGFVLVRTVAMRRPLTPPRP